MNSIIDCYLFDINELKEETIYQYILNLLPEVGLWNERRERILAYLKIEDKMRSIGAGLLLKHIFDINHMNYTDLKKNEYGKLYIDGLEKVKFNISHSGDFVVCTIGSSENGVDIEKNIYGIDIARKFFTKNEYQRIVQGTADMFTRIWTLKEAYMKEKGMGLNIPLDSFEVHPGTIKEITDGYCLTALSILEETVVTNDFEMQFREFKIKDYCISICSKAMITDKIYKIGVSQLIRVE